MIIATNEASLNALPRRVRGGAVEEDSPNAVSVRRWRGNILGDRVEEEGHESPRKWVADVRDPIGSNHSPTVETIP